jgi:hypothetical protein
VPGSWLAISSLLRLGETHLPVPHPAKPGPSACYPPTEVHFKNGERAPLLIVGTEKDQTVPASLARKQYEKYERSPATTESLEFEGRPHLLMAAEG